jgi:hypothetical protein
VQACRNRKTRNLRSLNNQHFHSAVCNVWITRRCEAYAPSMFVPRPFNRPVGLVRLVGGRIVLRIVSERGERMATELRPMTLADATGEPRFYERRPPR